MKHTKEPWEAYVTQYGDVAVHQEGRAFFLKGVSGDKITDIANTDRAVACVNALSGIEDPAAFMADARKMVEALEGVYIGCCGGEYDGKKMVHSKNCCIAAALSTPLALAVKAGRAK